MTAFRLLDTGLISAAENMALDEIIASRVGRGVSPPTLRYLRFSPDAALVGYHQDTHRELRLDYCREHGIEVNRRVTGGGAILFQSSALGWELFAPLGQPPFHGGFEAALLRICEAASLGLKRLGLDAAFRPRNDIEVDGRKISGTGGMVIDGGAMFQGTVLMVNEIERFLKALRVPVEKLKKREIESLMERVAFVNDLLGREVDLAEVKQALAEEFAESLGLEFAPGGLTPEEEAELDERLPFFRSEAHIHGKRPPGGAPSWLRGILQTPGGTLMVNLWLDRRGRLIQKALITGDFFSSPQRLVRDLEASLMGKKAEPEVLFRHVRDFLADSSGGLVGIAPEEAARAVSLAAERKALAGRFQEGEAAELFLVGLAAEEVGRRRARTLLLPYCSKPVECDYRWVADCGRCGDCQFAPLYELAEELDMRPVSIQSFEHLMEVMRELAGRGEYFVGSCCEAFYCKHQREMETSGAAGVLVNLDSTTCYDLGKGMAAYAGHFDNQTEMNLALIEKVARVMNHA